jgi:hypothetical protein
MVQPSLPNSFTSRLPALIIGSMVKVMPGLSSSSVPGGRSAAPAALHGSAGRCRGRRTRAPREALAFGEGLDGEADVAQAHAGLDLHDAVPHGLVGDRHRRLAAMEASPTTNMRLVSPCQPSLMTVTSTLTMSPFFSGLSFGMPWHTTWLTEVHSDFG